MVWKEQAGADALGSLQTSPYNVEKVFSMSRLEEQRSVALSSLSLNVLLGHCCRRDHVLS